MFHDNGKRQYNLENRIGTRNLLSVMGLYSLSWIKLTFLCKMGISYNSIVD